MKVPEAVEILKEEIPNLSGLAWDALVVVIDTLEKKGAMDEH